MNCQPLALVLILVRIGHKAVRGEAAWSQVLTDLLGSDRSPQGCLLTYLCPECAVTQRHHRAGGQQPQKPGAGTGGSGDKSILVALGLGMSRGSALVSPREAMEGERLSKMNEILGQ